MKNLKMEHQLKELQGVAKEIYGLYDLNKSIVWMVEEFGELISAIRKGKDKEDITGELGDLLDVGFGAGKRAAHDYDLFANIKRFNQLGCRQMAACSRKLFVEAISPVPPSERLGGSIAGTLWCMINGCSFIRVHDVRPYAQAIDVWNCINSRLDENNED